MSQPRILTLPGMGDLYWVFTKLESFLEKEGITEKPLIYTWEIQSHKRSRSKDYIKRVPFVEYGGEYIQPDTNVPAFKDLYFGTKWKIAPYEGFDYFLSMNGLLRNGFSLEEGELQQYTSNWFFPLTPAKQQYEIPSEPYILAYFTDDGMFTTWLKSLPPQKIFTLLSSLSKQTGYKIVLTGGAWDKSFIQNFLKYDDEHAFIDLVGDTSVDHLFQLMENAQAMVGWSAGNTIVSAALKTPTLVIWSSKYFQNTSFYTNCVPPAGLGIWHDVAIVERDTEHDMVCKMMKMIREYKKC